MQITDPISTSHARPAVEPTRPARPDEPAARYIAPGWFTARVFNPTVAFVTRRGVSLWGSKVLAVPGRKTGRVHTVPVNLLTIDGDRYLVAPRGVTQWVRNVRVAGGAELRVGRRTEQVQLDELDDIDKPDVLRAYLRRWKWEVGQFFDGVGPDSTDEELRAIASGHPVFRVRRHSGSEPPAGMDMPEGDDPTPAG